MELHDGAILHHARPGLEIRILSEGVVGLDSEGIESAAGGNVYAGVRPPAPSAALNP
jgi:hypothetical protein